MWITDFELPFAAALCGFRIIIFCFRWFDNFEENFPAVHPEILRELRNEPPKPRFANLVDPLRHCSGIFGSNPGRAAKTDSS